MRFRSAIVAISVALPGIPSISLADKVSGTIDLVEMHTDVESARAYITNVTTVCTGADYSTHPPAVATVTRRGAADVDSRDVLCAVTSAVLRAVRLRVGGWSGS